MTVCNYGHRGQARSGMVAIDVIKDHRLLPAAARSRPSACCRDHRQSAIGARCTRMPAPGSTASSTSMRATSSRRSPGALRPKWCCPSMAACPIPIARRTTLRRSGMEPRSSTWASSPMLPLVDIASDRVFIGSCTNSRIEDLRGPVVARAASLLGRQRAPGHGGAGFRAGQATGRAREGWTRSSSKPASSGASGLFDVPGHECPTASNRASAAPRPQPQLRRPPGAGQAHAPGQPGDGPPPPRWPAISSTSASFR